MSDVEAVIVAGGLGSRLMPLTEHRPKHLLPVGGVPFVTHQLAKLAASGVDRVVLATGYHADQFEPSLGDGGAWGIELVYSFEAGPLGTAGAIRAAADELRSAPDEAVVILNGDILSSHDLRGQLAYHESSRADVTLHLVEVSDARPYGSVPTDADGRVLAFLEKSADPVSTQINAGCYVFTRRVVDRIPPGQVVSVERETFPELLRTGGRVMAWVESAYWRDVGTPAALLDASIDLVTGVATSPAVTRAPADVWADASADIDLTASVTGGTTVGAGARIGAGAVVDACVIDVGTRVGPGASISRSVLGVGVEVGAGAVLVGAVLGDRAQVAPGSSPPVGEQVAGGTG